MQRRRVRYDWQNGRNWMGVGLRAIVATVVVALAPLAALPNGSPASVAAVRSRTEFDRLARVYHVGRGTPMPHVMFVIDRANHDAVYYVDSKQFRFHKEFVNATYLSLERSDAFYAKNYS